jgi:hypothetical protein
MGKGVNKGIQVYVAAAIAGPAVNWATADGSFYPLNADEHGNIFANFVVDIAGTPTIVSGGDNTADSLAASLVGINTRGFGYLFNETTWDRERNNTNPVLLASAARTVTTNSPVQTNHNAQGAHFIINFTASGGIIDLDPIIQAEVPSAPGTFYDLLVGTNIVATGLIVLKVSPGITATAGAAASDILPRSYRFRMVHNNANSQTYSVDAALVL